MGLPKKKQKIDEAAIYDKIKGDRYSQLIYVYDEASVLLFDKPQKKLKKKEE